MKVTRVTEFGEAEPETAPAPLQQYPNWFQRVSAILFIVFCLEVGLFLLVFPWTEKWDDNLFATFLSRTVPEWQRFWHSSYSRGAMSGLGVINLYISVWEIVRFRRFSRH